jgi:hypothetical protein
MTPSAMSSAGRCVSAGFGGRGNDPYVVYSHDWNEVPTPERRLVTLDTRLATKLVYTMRF